MELLYAPEHLACINYTKGENFIVKLYSLASGEMIEQQLEENQIVFVVEGSLVISYEGIRELPVSDRKIIMLPTGCKFTAEAIGESKVFVCKLKHNIRLCKIYSLHELYRDNSEHSENCQLDFNERITAFLEGFIPCIQEGLCCYYYIDIKILEMFFIFRAYYPKEQLADFFAPLLSDRPAFTEFVLENYRQVKGVADFAKLANYSLSGFKKRFKQTFGMPVSQWIAARKSKEIYNDLCHSARTLKEICDDYSFSSPSHLNHFCLKHFGRTPMQIRKYGLSNDSNGC